MMMKKNKYEKEVNNVFADAVNCLKGFVLEGEFVKTENAVELKQLSNDMCVAIAVTMDKEYIDFDETSSFCINIQDLHSVLNEMSGDYKVKVGKDKVIIEGANDKFELRQTEFSGNKLKDEMYKDLKSKLKTSVKISVNDLYEKFKRAKMADDSVVFVLGRNSLEIRSGDDAKSYKGLLNASTSNFSEEKQVRIADSFLENMLKPTKKIFKDVNIFMETDMPIMFEFEKKGLKIVYIIAPRVEE